MDERLQLFEKYNFWNGQFSELGLIRYEYIMPIANAMENRLVNFEFAPFDYIAIQKRNKAYTSMGYL